MPSYEELLGQVFTEVNDFERNSTSSEFQRTLCEVSLCILLLQTQAQKSIKNILFPASVPINLFQQIPIIDIYIGGDIDHATPDLLIPVTFRNQEGVDLPKGNIDSLRYYKDSFSVIQDVPRTCYQIATNLIGLRPGVTFDLEIQLTYVPYIEILNLNEPFPLDNNFIQPYLRLLRSLLFMRISRFELAKEELRRFKEYVG